MEKTKKKVKKRAKQKRTVVIPVHNPVSSKKRFILPLFLILIILVAVGYVCYEKHQEKVAEKEGELLRAFTSSLALGIFNEAITCTPIPINNGSLEINLIAVECLPAPDK